jgi:aminoglycoside phosphotransferase (APT) family kinase protein
VALGVRDVRRLTGGRSSLTFAGVLADGEPVVIKVAPPGVEPTLNRDVLRQARLLRSLESAGVSVPTVLFEDRGAPPELPPLFVMSFVEGDSLEPLFDLEGHGSVEVMAERLRHAAETMAALHGVTPEAVGLGAEPVVGVADEIDRWSALLETVDPELAPGWAEVAEALRATSAAPMAPAIVHGDFRLGNLLAHGTEITAIIDWEIWTIGDPRVDVGWFLINADPATYARPTPYVGLMPPVDELAARYAEALGRPVTDLEFFRALACFKSVATWSLIVKHNRRRDVPDPEVEAMATALPRLLGAARSLLG